MWTGGGFGQGALRRPRRAHQGIVAGGELRCPSERLIAHPVVSRGVNQGI